MDLLSLLSSINIIGLIAFLVTLGFLIYEVILLKKENKTEEKPAIPQFQENTPVAVQMNQPFQESQPTVSSRKTNMIIIFLFVLLIIFGAVTLIGFFAGSNQKKIVQVPIVPTSKPSPTTAPSSIPTPTITLSPTETRLKTNSPTPALSPSPTIVIVAKATSLPETGNFSNLLILFTTASVFVFLAFLF